MRILILGQVNGGLNGELVQAAQSRGHRCEVVSIPSVRSTLGSSCVKLLAKSDAGLEIDLREFDVCLMRGMPPGSLEQIIYRMDLLWTLEQTGMPILNPPKAMECAIDKFLTLSRCQQAGLSIPESSCSETVEEALTAFQELGGDVVAKPIFGAEGRGMLRLTDFETARRVFYTWQQIGAVLFQQRFINAEMSDIRVMVLGGKAIGAIRRTGTNDFRANCAQQGTAQRHELTQEEAELAESACRATGVIFGGVDLIRDTEGRLYLLEVNACPGWKHFQAVTEINIPQRLVSWLEDQYSLI